MTSIRAFWLVLLVAVLAAAAPAVAADCPSEVSFWPAVDASTADTGFTGLALGRPIFGNTMRLAVSCAASVSPCGTCNITGALPDTHGTFQRCVNDTSLACTPATEVADCGAPGTCRIFLTVPQFVATSGVYGCYTNEITGPVSGTVDESGALAVSVSYLGRIYLGGDPNSLACPRCVGDSFANDGLRDGTCASGLHVGGACDANGPPPSGYEEVGASSFDCPSNPLAQVASLSAGAVTFSTGTQTRTLTTASPACTGTGASGRKCFCDTCNDAAAEPCQTNADCPPSGGNPGICGGRRCDGGPNDGTPCSSSTECAGASCRRLGEFTRPNTCFDDTATPASEAFLCADVGTPGDGLGECVRGPVDKSCTNHPARGCTSDGDCDGVPGACVAHSRACYVTDGTVGQSISAVGVATPPDGGVSDPTVLGMITCQGSSRVSAIDAVVGLPGLARNRHVGTLAVGPDFGVVCPTAPDACRAPFVPHKSPLTMKDRTPDTKDQLKWQWSKGAATTLAELGDPTTTDAYVLCVYDAQGLRMNMSVPAGGTCDGRPCWKASSTGFRYQRKDGALRGITKLVLRAGADGKAKIQATGAGDFLPLPPLPSLDAPLQVQIRNRTSGLCWSASYPAPLEKQTASDLKARD